MPVFALNSGRMWPNSPESWVDVVDATTIDLSCAVAALLPSRVAAAAAITSMRWIGSIRFSSVVVGSGSEQQLAGEEAARLLGGGCGEETLRRARFDDAPAVHQHDLAGEPAR